MSDLICYLLLQVYKWQNPGAYSYTWPQSGGISADCPMRREHGASSLLPAFQMTTPLCNGHGCWGCLFLKVWGGPRVITETMQLEFDLEGGFNKKLGKSLRIHLFFTMKHVPFRNRIGKCCCCFLVVQIRHHQQAGSPVYCQSAGHRIKLWCCHISKNQLLMQKDHCIMWHK